jgi:hypothetical protein
VLRWVHGPNGGVADSLNEAKAAFPAWERPFITKDEFQR